MSEREQGYTRDKRDADRFLEFLKKIAREGGWEYGNGDPMTADARAFLEREAARWLDAAEVIEFWGDYAPNYFQEKHDLYTDVLKYSSFKDGFRVDGLDEQRKRAER